MKPIITLFAIALVMVHCGPPRKTLTGEPTATSRFNSGASPVITKNSSADTIIVTGTEYLEVLGRNENGMYPELEGLWELEAMPKGKLASNKNLIRETEKENAIDGKPYTGNVLGESMKGSIETGRETTTKKTEKGTTTETTVFLVNKDNPEKRITPPQGDNFHYPNKPTISLFGSNETFSGFTGCNKIAGRYAISKNNGITFSHSAPSTRMVCIGDYDEKVFLEALKRVNKYRSSGKQLELLDGDEVLFVFARK